MSSTRRLLHSSILSLRASPSHTARLPPSYATYEGLFVLPSRLLSSQPQLVNPYSRDLQQKGVVDPATFHLHVHSTRNNTIATFTNQDGNPIAYWTGGSCGFKKSNRSSYEAGYQCTVKAFEKILDHRNEVGPFLLEIFFKGFGQGREAMQKALLASEGEKIRPFVTRLTDNTPIKIGGTRGKKARRL